MELRGLISNIDLGGLVSINVQGLAGINYLQRITGIINLRGLEGIGVYVYVGVEVGIDLEGVASISLR